MIDGLILGAYAMEPKRTPLVGAEEERWYNLLSAIPGAAGIELPYKGAFHPEGRDRMSRLLPDAWRIVVTFLPATMAGLRADPTYGLASNDADGRAAAVADLGTLFEDAQAWREESGVERLVAVQVPSAPGRAAGTATSAAALQRSLEEIGGWQWGTTSIVVEHCDAAIDGQPAQKGFLTMGEETEAVLGARANVASTLGQSINWGRSAIEGRSAATPVEHIASAVAAGTLTGVFFSGASAVGGPLGGAWNDVHDPVDSFEPESLLSTVEIGASLAAAGPGLSYMGIKVQDPADADDLGTRLDPLRATAAAVLAQVNNR